MKRIINIVFVINIFFVFLIGFIYSVFKEKDINEYENRVAYRFELPTINNVLNKKFQDNVELTLADQIPFSIDMKKTYNTFNSYYINSFSNLFFKNVCSNKYIYIKEGVNTFGCDGVLVYLEDDIDSRRKKIQNRIDNINKVVDENVVDVYVYYIERDRDIDFESNEKLNMIDTLKKGIKLEKIDNFEINNFDDYKKYFYKTDHHWNYQGSYKAYLELLELLDIDDEPLIPNRIVHTDLEVNGSMAREIGESSLYSEKFSFYEFKYPKYKVYANGLEMDDYGSSLTKINEEISMYSILYGVDYGELILDFKQSAKENILLVGESYDNAIIKLLGSHFNKIYSIDLRHYENQNNQKFNYKKYVEENDIDKILLIGNIDFFAESTFNLN